MRLLTVAGLVVLLALMIGPAIAGPAPPLYPLVSDWQQYFRVDAESATREGGAVVSGNVWNISRWSTKRIQLLVERLNTSGQPAAQRIVWLGADLPAGMHAYFAVPMPDATSYRVSVFAFNRGGGRWG